jgi:hypothetical protein
VFFRGVNFTAERGAPYGSAASIAQLKRLPEYGINSIALVPYAMMRPGETSLRWFGSGGWEPDEGLRTLIAEAHALKMKVLLKPQVWIPRGFTGDLAFEAPGDRDRWFAEYARYILHHAALAMQAKADLFCVGTEFVKLRDSPNWAPLIAQTRKVYPGPVLYAATQGPEFETLTFWDQLDYIGLNNYYPLPDSHDCAPLVAKVEAVARKFRRPVLFTEAGFASLENPHRQPWDETPRKISLEDQARCYEVLLQAFYSKPWMQGFFFWKIGTNGFGGPSDGSHTPWGKPAMDVMSRWYRSGRRS